MHRDSECSTLIAHSSSAGDSVGASEVDIAGTSAVDNKDTFPTVADVIAVMEEAYPLSLAESWDHPGLIAGDPSWPVNKVCCAVDLTDEVLAEALALGDGTMIITHHPLLFSAVHSVAATTNKGRIIQDAISHKCALYCAHTNADNANPGVNDALAECLGLDVEGPLVPLSQKSDHDSSGDHAAQKNLDRWVVHVPTDHVDEVHEAVFSAGAGAVGDYSECSFRVTGTGQFKPNEDAHPFLGSRSELTEVTEARLEFVAARSLRSEVYRALIAAHPYEEPSFDIIETQFPPTAVELAPSRQGTGRITHLPEPMSLRAFAERVAAKLPFTASGVRVAGNPDQLITTVALCGGAGDSFLSTAARAGVDCYLTSDLRHHPVDDIRRDYSLAVIDTAHAASEFPWLTQVAQLLRTQVSVDVVIAPVVTDPWSFHLPSPQLPHKERSDVHGDTHGDLRSDVNSDLPDEEN